MYRQSIKDPEGFWGAHGERIDWIRPYTKVKDVGYGPGEVSIRWFYDGTLNVSANCVDRHAERTPDKIAIIWEGDDPGEDRKFTYRELKSEVCRMANVLKSLGARRGDRVTIYMPMIPEVAFAMLACARIGAIHSVVFGGFSPHALAGRISDCSSEIVITAGEELRGARRVPLKVNTDKALEDGAVDSIVKKVLVVRRTGADVPWDGKRDVWYHEAAVEVSDDCAVEEMDAEDPLFILYTSGSTGKPKGALHTTNGYLVYASMTHQYVFDYHDGEIYWCTADVGWVTGHSYIVYGPLANGATTVMFEGVPGYPDMSRFWRVCDKHNVSIFYTAPTAIRALMREGDGPVKETSRASFRVLGTLGEPINSEAWMWYYEVVGDGCRRDEDGYYWITGRVDDVINVSGHRMGTAEVESALVSHGSVAEAAVVGYPHEIKGQGIYAYVTLNADSEPSEELRGELVKWVRKEIGPIASPDLIQWAPGIPKTRSGKIVRRILRRIAANDYADLGDTSTLADPSVVDNLIDNRMNR